MPARADVCHSTSAVRFDTITSPCHVALAFVLVSFHLQLQPDGMSSARTDPSCGRRFWLAMQSSRSCEVHALLAQVAKHDRLDDAWIVISGEVYSVTSWLEASTTSVAPCRRAQAGSKTFRPSRLPISCVSVVHGRGVDLQDNPTQRGEAKRQVLWPRPCSAILGLWRSSALMLEVARRREGTNRCSPQAATVYCNVCGPLQVVQYQCASISSCRRSRSRVSIAWALVYVSFVLTSAY